MPVAAISSSPSTSRIRVLPDLLVNKIAAGEVIERPASVVKELLENAIDAGAKRIGVTIEEGGRRLIRVTDDGCGMSAEDLRLAITPHATSKVIYEEDLYSIQTLGFRGEALASVAAVSQLRLVSRPAGSIEGHEIRMAGDRFESSLAAGCAEGTTVEVRELFFNVPARRKFLRSPSTEAGHITEQFSRVALANPQISFEMSSNGRTVQQLPAADSRAARIAKFYGPELSPGLMHVERDERGLHLEIFAAPPSQSRATTQWQYVFVNGRFIRDRSIQHALKEAYRGLMEPDRHGVVFVFLRIDPSQVDVNVHPTKIEVRWADSQMVYSSVLSALRETFQRNDLTPRMRTSHSVPPVDPALQERISRQFAESIKAGGPGGFGTAGAFGSPAETNTNTAGSELGIGPEGYRPPSTWQEAANIWRPLYGGPQTPIDPDRPVNPGYGFAPPESHNPQGAGLNTISGGHGPQADSRGTARPLAPGAALRPRAVQMHNLYLVCETDEGILIIDQHALHERVMYEQLLERFSAGPLESQRLLLAETLRVSAQQAALLENHGQLLSRLGIEVTSYGVDSIAVHSFPAMLKDTQVVDFMRDLLDVLASQPESAAPSQAELAEVLIHKVLDLMACKAAVKAGDPLTTDEIESLMGKRYLIEKSSSCPHGRPTSLRLTKADLNRQFKRT